MLGQLMKMLTGVGFHVPADYIESAGETYSFMLSGTFVNANDLASVAVMIGLFFMISRPLSDRFYHSAIVTISVIVLLTASRSSLVVFVGMLLFYWGSRSIVKTVLAFIGLAFLFYFFYVWGVNVSGQYDAVDRVINRLNSLFLIASGGLRVDNSLSLRIESYLHFLSNLPALSLGTRQYQDYTAFVSELGPRFSLLELNPHSFVVEVGYWLGWPGLLALILFLASCFSFKKPLYSVLLLAAFLVLSSVSSSIIGNFIFMLVFFFCLTLMMRVNVEGGENLRLISRG